MHARLITHRDAGLPLSQWRRAFFLSPGLNPTRRALIDVPFIRGMNGDDWFFPRGPHHSVDAVTANRELMNRFLETLELQDNPGGHGRTQGQQHRYAPALSLRTVFEQLLLGIRMTRVGDSMRYYGVLMQISAWLEVHPDAMCDVYRMRPTESTFRSVNTSDDMRNLHQGPGGNYPGDLHIKAATGVSVQLHFVEIRDSAGTSIANDVPVLAIWIPNELSRPFLIQQQP
jgi:hypothetical protein